MYLQELKDIINELIKHNMAVQNQEAKVLLETSQVDCYELRIRSYREKNGDGIRPPCTKTVNDRFFLRMCPYTTRRYTS